MLEGNLRFILLKNEEELDIALSIICELKERRRLLRGIERGNLLFPEIWRQKRWKVNWIK